MKEKKKEADSCPYNEGVACLGKKQCETCGWHPDVTRARDEELRQKLGIKMDD